jgi:chromosome segregation ATPase
MIIATEDDLTTLQERRRQLSDRLEELRSELPDIQADVAACETDWLDAVTIGEDSGLLASRVDLRKAELANNRKAADHITTLLADVDRQIADVTAKAQFRDDESAYLAARTEYSETLDDLPDSLPACVEVINDALTALLEQIDIARRTHDQLAGMAGSLRQRAEQLDVDVFAPDPESWSAGLERIHHKDVATRQLALSLMQRRGIQSVIAEVTRLIMLDAEAKRKAAR